MDDDQKLLIQQWKAVLKKYLDPVKTMDALPEFFPLNSEIRHRVYDKIGLPHEGIDIILEELMVSRNHSHSAYLRLIEVIGKDHEWLSPLVTGKFEECEFTGESSKLVYQDYIIRILTRILPRLTEVIEAGEMSFYLKSKEFLTREDEERVNAKIINSGNAAGVRMLFSILFRKPLGWLKEFKEVARYLEYDETIIEILDDIPDDPKRFLEISLSDSPISIHSSKKSGCTVVHPIHDRETSNSVDITLTETCIESVQERGNEAAPEMQTFHVGYCTNPIRKNPLDLGDTIFLEDLHGCNMPYQPTFTEQTSPTNDHFPKKSGYNGSSPRSKTEEEIMINKGSFTEQMEARRPPANENIPIKAAYNGSVPRSQIKQGSTKKPRSFSGLTKAPSPPANGIIPREARYNGIPSRSKTKEVVTENAISFSKQMEARSRRVNDIIPSEARYNGNPSRRSTKKVLTENAVSTSKQMGARSHHVNNVIPREARFSSAPLRSKLETPLKENAIFGENTIIFTGQSLKVVADIVKRRFPNILDSADRKICFLVPEITGKCDTLKFIFATEQWSVGFYYHESSTPLNVLMQDSQVIITTAQSLLGWLALGSDVDKITEFDMLIFDECQRACQQGPYREVLLKYLGAKSNSRKVSLPQVIGLTTSDVSGRILCQSDADKYIQELVALFDARGGVEVLESESPKTHSRLTSSKTKSTKERNTMISDPFIFCLCKTIDSIVDQLYKLQIGKIKGLRRPLSISKGTPEYLKWCEDLMKKADLLEDKTLKSDIEICAKYLVSFNTGLLIKTKCRSVDAANALTRDLQNIAMGLKTGANRRLVEQRMMQISANTQKDLKTLLNDRDVRDPSSLQEIKNKIKGRKSGQIFIFVEDMEIVEPLQSWIREDIELKRFLEGVPVSILIYHRHDSTTKLSPSDLVIYYDCCLSQFGAKGQLQTPKPIDIKSTAIVANDKAKFSKSLLINHSVKEIQRKRQENKRGFTNELDQFQAALLSRSCGNHPVRNSRRSS